MSVSDNPTALINSKLFDEKTFYSQFLNDLASCKNEVIIESPYITTARMKDFWPVFNKILKKEVKIYIFSRDPKEHEGTMAYQAEAEIQNFERIDIQTLICTGNHHRKLAIIDRKVLWEGSLNILSQAYSREIMRRMEGQGLALETFNFLKLGRFV